LKTTLILSSVTIFALGLWLLWSRRPVIIFRRITGFFIVAYGLYLSTLTASVIKFVVPGIGAIGTGAATGAGIGALTGVMLGTIGVVTGGAGYAVGATVLALIGGSLGAAGAATGGFGFQVFKYPVVHPMFWLPLVAIGLVLIFRPKHKEDTN